MQKDEGEESVYAILVEKLYKLYRLTYNYLYLLLALQIDMWIIYT